MSTGAVPGLLDNWVLASAAPDRIAEPSGLNGMRNSIAQAMPSSRWTPRVAPISSRDMGHMGSDAGRYACRGEAERAGVHAMAN